MMTGLIRLLRAYTTERCQCGSAQPRLIQDSRVQCGNCGRVRPRTEVDTNARAVIGAGGVVIPADMVRNG